MQKMRLTKHFDLHEATRSTKADELGITNTPTDVELATIHRTAVKMERVRELLGNPVVPSSWFRCEALNKAVRGSPTSQHKTGEAVDFRALGLTIAETIQILLDNAAELQFDQLIKEPSWVHISFLTANESRNKKPRMQYLDLSK